MNSFTLLPMNTKNVFQYGGHRYLKYTRFDIFEVYETDIGLIFIKKKGLWYQIIAEENSFWYDPPRRGYGS